MKWTVVRASCLALLFLCLGAISTTAQRSLVSTGSVWRYLDTGADPGTDWRVAGFDDNSWLSGPAQLGFSSDENDEVTVIFRTDSLGETIITFYFRHTFNVAEVSAYTNLLVRLRRDDGAVVYLNGVEVFRSNMPSGTISHGTLAFLAQDDGAAIFAGPVDRALLVPGENLLAVELHQTSTTSSDVSFDLELLGNVMFEHPQVSIASPETDSVLGSSSLVITALASDVDGTVSMVELVEGGNVVGITTGPPFSFTVTNLVPGHYSFNAVAVDSTGLSATSAPVAITVVPWLVPSRANWTYLDDGSEPGATWTSPAFDDSGWSNGVAQFGFGEGDETTPIRRFSDLSGTNILAYYFRHKFSVANPASVSSLAVRLLRDDGGAVYLNGTEIFRNNLPSGPLDSTTTAVLVAEDSVWRAMRVNPQLLVSGMNILAVEVHQVNLTSSDVSFDLELLPNLAPRRPSVSLTAPLNSDVFLGPIDIIVSATATDVDDAVASVGFFLDGYQVGSATAEPYSVELENLLGNHSLTAVATDSTGLSSTSAPVNIGIARVVPLIKTESIWKYLDTGVDQGTGWSGVGFDDSSWPSGPGKLGTNDGAVTIIRIFNSNGLPVRTSYYRHQFNVANPSSITNLEFRVLRDDGCIAYLNGAEIFRMNMPAGNVTFNTFASTAIGGANETTYFPTNIGPGLLVEGANLLAVELHQASGTRDAGFDLGLAGIGIPPANVPPLTIQHVGNTVRISWPGSGLILQEAAQPGGPYTNRPGITSPLNISPPAGNRYYRLVRP